MKEEKIVKLTILHSNDTHGKVEAVKGFGSMDIGGVVFRSSLISEIKSEISRENNHYSMVVDLGDILEGDPMSHFFEGQIDILAMNHMKYEASVIGNHELGFSIKSFEKMMETAKFPFLSCNLKYKHDNKYIGKPYLIKEYGDISVGYIGVTSDTILLNTFNEDQDKIIFENPEEKVKKYISEVKNRVNYIILLSHLGIEEDREIASKIDEIDFIIGSHSHTWIETPEYVNGIPIVQAGAYAKSMGRSEITFENGKFKSLYYRLMDIGDYKLGQILFKYHNELNLYMDHIVGELDREYNTEDKNRKPASLNQLILQLTMDMTGADIAMATAISVLGKLGPGKITRRDLYDVLPFDNYVTTLKINGSDLKKVLKVRRGNYDTNYYIQVRGIDFFDDEELDGTINGEKIDDDRIYTLVTDNYLASGGGKDGILPTLDSKIIDNKISRDLLMEFIERTI